MDLRRPHTARPAPDDAEPIVSFAAPEGLDPRPRVLVQRLLYARSLVQASAILEPRFLLGGCAAAHHFVLGSPGAGLAAFDRLLELGFRVEPWRSPAGIRCVVTSAHREAEIRALLVAIAIVIREQAPRT